MSASRNFPSYDSISDKKLCETFIQLILANYSAPFTSKSSRNLLNTLRNSNTALVDKWNAMGIYFENQNYRSKDLHKIINSFLPSLMGLNNPPLLINEHNYWTKALRDFNAKDRKKLKDEINYYAKRNGLKNGNLYTDYLLATLNEAEDFNPDVILKIISNPAYKDCHINAVFSDVKVRSDKLAKRFFSLAESAQDDESKKTYYQKTLYYLRYASSNAANIEKWSRCNEFLGLQQESYAELKKLKFGKYKKNESLQTYRNKALDCLLREAGNDLVLKKPAGSTSHSFRDFIEPLLTTVEIANLPTVLLFSNEFTFILGGLWALGASVVGAAIGVVPGLIRSSTRSPLSSAEQGEVLANLKVAQNASYADKAQMIRNVIQHYAKVRCSSSDSSKELFTMLKQGHVSPNHPQGPLNEVLINKQWLALQNYMLQKTKSGNLYQNNGKTLYLLIHSELRNYQPQVESQYRRGSRGLNF